MPVLVWSALVSERRPDNPDSPQPYTRLAIGHRSSSTWNISSLVCARFPAVRVVALQGLADGNFGMKKYVNRSSTAPRTAAGHRGREAFIKSQTHTG